MLPDRQKPEHLSGHLNSNIKLNSKPDLFSSTFLFEQDFFNIYKLLSYKLFSFLYLLSQGQSFNMNDNHIFIFIFVFRGDNMKNSRNLMFNEDF